MQRCVDRSLRGAIISCFFAPFSFFGESLQGQKTTVEKDIMAPWYLAAPRLRGAADGAQQRCEHLPRRRVLPNRRARSDSCSVTAKIRGHHGSLVLSAPWVVQSGVHPIPAGVCCGSIRLVFLKSLLKCKLLQRILKRGPLNSVIISNPHCRYAPCGMIAAVRLCQSVLRSRE